MLGSNRFAFWRNFLELCHFFRRAHVFSQQPLCLARFHLFLSKVFGSLYDAIQQFQISGSVPGDQNIVIAKKACRGVLRKRNTLLFKNSFKRFPIRRRFADLVRNLGRDIPSTLLHIRISTIGDRKKDHPILINLVTKLRLISDMLERDSSRHILELEILDLIPGEIQRSTKTLFPVRRQSSR